MMFQPVKLARAEFRVLRCIQLKGKEVVLTCLYLLKLE